MRATAVKVVVTGSEGFLGRATVELAAECGAEVLRCDRAVVSRPKAPSLQMDVCDLGQVFEALEGADAVIHLAAFRDDRLVTPSATFRANVLGTHNVLTASRMLGVPKVVLASSNRVVVPRHEHGWPGYEYLPFDEDHPVFPQGDYARSKHVGEALADSMATEFDLDVVSLRYVAIVDVSKHVYPVAASRTNFFNPFYVDVTDAAKCTWLAATSTPAPGRHARCFVTAADSALDLPSTDFAREYFPETEWRGDGDQPFCSLVSGRRARELFGFEPTVSWRDREVAAPATAPPPAPRRWQRQSRRGRT